MTPAARRATVAIALGSGSAAGAGVSTVVDRSVRTSPPISPPMSRTSPPSVRMSPETSPPGCRITSPSTVTTFPIRRPYTSASPRSTSRCPVCVSVEPTL